MSLTTTMRLTPADNYENIERKRTTTRSTIERTIQEITEHIDSCCYGDTDEDTQCGACTAAHSSLQALDNFLSELDEKRGSR